MDASIGGDEFAILLIEAGTEQARRIVNKLTRVLNDIMRRKQYGVTFSFGVVTFLKAPNSVDDMIKKADDMMYLAKRNGKNRVNYFIFR